MSQTLCRFQFSASAFVSLYWRCRQSQQLKEGLLKGKSKVEPSAANCSRLTWDHETSEPDGHVTTASKWKLDLPRLNGNTIRLCLEARNSKPHRAATTPKHICELISFNSV